MESKFEEMEPLDFFQNNLGSLEIMIDFEKPSMVITLVKGNSLFSTKKEFGEGQNLALIERK